MDQFSEFSEFYTNAEMSTSKTYLEKVFFAPQQWRTCDCGMNVQQRNPRLCGTSPTLLAIPVLLALRWLGDMARHTAAGRPGQKKGDKGLPRSIF
ncbi:MAG TPA: hypothetical protein VE890_10020 [Thermoguttaceae bacterium]|nr:hypothetical protein [Thermoguttaceae bacterium]